MAQNFLLLYNGVLDERVVIKELLCHGLSLSLRCLAMRQGFSSAMAGSVAMRARTFSAREFHGGIVASGAIVGDFCRVGRKINGCR